MNNCLLLLIIPFAVLLPLYLRAENQNRFKKATVLKLVLSGICVSCAFLGMMFSHTHDGLFSISSGLSSAPVTTGFYTLSVLFYSRLLVVIALVCAATGDYFLQFIKLDERKFSIGVAFFALTQVFLIGSLSLKHGISWPEFTVTAFIFMLVFLMMKKQKWQLGRAMVSLSAYMALVTFMMSKAVLALFVVYGIVGSEGGAGIPYSENAAVFDGTGIILMSPAALMAVGAVLIFISDLLLGISTFKPDNKIKMEPKLTAYFCGLMLIALSNA